MRGRGLVTLSYSILCKEKDFHEKKRFYCEGLTLRVRRPHHFPSYEQRQNREC
ncbi:hypothetical protein GTCCBUS3UF5_9520 [Geobacillus thermoleovorans CCB_US3_UF5]|uniref:Uncharacterized protein n=1 Tax=Geobacillus thermoleovorans CCB_US3_UF5 TaxID=1111068 RepID=A0ABN3ZSM4_GEOTH|nr:hypothetical protein GTCCBUS3UF5_9520 [Geobacillus thermoleovorans CCB_US3_UF5]